MAETPIVPRKRFSLQTLSYAVTGIVVAFLAGLSFLVASHLAQLQHIAEESRTVTIPLALEQSNTNQILRQISLLAEIVANNPSAQDRIRASRDALRLLRTLMNRSPSTRKSIFNDIFRSLQQLSVFTDNLHKERENLTLILQKISAQHSDKEALDILRLRLHMSSIAAIIDLAQLNHAKEEYAGLFKAASPRTQALFTGHIELFDQQKSIIILHAKIDRLTLEIHQKLALAALESSGNAALVASNAAATIAERARTARTAALGGFGILASAFFFSWPSDSQGSRQTCPRSGKRPFCPLPGQRHRHPSSFRLKGNRCHKPSCPPDGDRSRRNRSRQPASYRYGANENQFHQQRQPRTTHAAHLYPGVYQTYPSGYGTVIRRTRRQ
ncbi:MAG: hypothetical protein ACK59C_08255 [Holosporales bacterium]